VEVLFQCAAFCTSLQSLLVGANSFDEAELHRKLSKSGVPIETFLSQRRGVLSYLSYPHKDAEKVAQDMRTERGRNGCLVVKMVVDAAADKDRSLRSSRAATGDYSILLIPERVDFQLQSLLETLTVSSNVSNPANFFPSGVAANVQSLNLSACNLRSSSHSALISVLQCLPALLELNLSLNHFPDDSILSILQVTPSSLKTLIVCNAGLCASGLLASKFFSQFKFVSITYVDVSDNTELQASGFAFLLQSCSVQNLTRLRASNCGIDLCKSEGTDHLQGVVSIFRQATLLHSLDLSKNALGDSAVEGILRAMSPDPENFGCSNPARRSVNVSLNRPQQALSRWVSPLKYLNLSFTACDQVDSASTYHFDKWFNSILAYLSNLIHLYLSENQCLFNVNPSVSCLRNLEFLDLSHCKNLLTIPDELILGTGTRKFGISLVGCDSLQHPPKRKADEGLDAMRRFVLGIEKTELRHVKVVLLGNGGSGKRSLLCALANIRDSEHKSFDEINQLVREQYKSKKSWFAKTFTADSCPTLSFWNFGGQLEYSSHLKFYMSARQTVYVIVFNVLESREVLVQQISYWLRAVFDCSGSQQSFRIFLIGSHIDAVHPSLLDKHKEGILDLIQKLLVAMSVVHHVDRQIFFGRWFSADARFPDQQNEVRRIAGSIFDSSLRMFEGLDIPLFPKSYLGMIKEVEKLAERCEDTKKFPLIKLADLTKADGFEILAGSDRNLRKLDAIKLLSEVGVLIHYTDLQEQPWICVNLNFCVDVVMLFTNSLLKLRSDSAFSHESVMSKEDLYRKFKRFFETAVTSVSWYTSSLSQGYPESLFGFFVAQGLLFPVSALQFQPQLERGSIVESVDSELLSTVASDKTLFMIPLLLKGRPDSWREVFGHLLHSAAAAPAWGFGLPIRIKGLRFSSQSIEFMITVPSFLKLMLGRCCDSRFMWGASFVYHVDGTSIFVRLAEDRHGVDVVTIGPEAPISAAVDREIEHIALELGLNERQSQRLCPRCCTLDDYVKSGTVRVYFQPQLDHYREYGHNAKCHHNHELMASDVEDGWTLQMPAARDAENSFFPNDRLANESL